MKILELNATYGFGSTGLIAKDIGELLKQNGDDVRYAYQQGDCDSSEGYRIGSPLDWKRHALYTRIFGMQAWGSRHATKKLIAYMEQETPNVVHLHNLHANYLNLPLLLKYLAKKNIATVVTLHDCWNFTGKCCHFVSAQCDRWKNGCGHCPKQKESPSSLFFDRSAKVAGEKSKLFRSIPNLTVVGCSKWISNLAKESFVFHDCRITQIYNGVDTTVFSPKDRDACKKKLGMSDQYVILGMANKWLDEKNAEVLQTVVSHLTEQETLVLVGCTEAQKKAVKHLSKVIAVSYIRDRDQLAEYYNSADVFVNLTFEDTLPTVNMEALCCGTPVITYDSCGSPELVEEGVTGFVISQLDCDGLLTSLEKVRQGMIQRDVCIAYGQRAFRKKERYEEYISLFHQVM